MICAGTAEQVEWGDGNWIFLDIGFSSRKDSCGLLVGDREPRCLKFAEAEAEIGKVVAKMAALNLVVQAPLSVCFRSGNPTRRRIEIEGSQTRCWYTGAGAAVMVASMYLLRELWVTENSIRLFEGFVSYKAKPRKRGDHGKDVYALRRVVHDPPKYPGAIHGADQLKDRPTDDLFSAFRVAGLDCGIPAVIKPRANDR